MDASAGKPVLCKMCTKTVTQVEIQCNMCKCWYHGKCDKIPKQSFQALINDEGLHYICNKCKPLSDTWDTFVSVSANNMEEVQNVVAALQIQVNNVEDRVSSLESQIIFKDKSEFDSAVNDELVPALEQAKIELKAEAHDVASRRTNIFI